MAYMKCVFLELYGIPGVGKTTIAKILNKKFQNMSQRVIMYSEMFQKLQESDMWRIKLFLSEFDWRLFKCFWFSLRMVSSISKRSMFDIKYIVFVIMNILAYKKFTKFVDGIVICDEGVIQYIFSLFYDREIQNLNPIQLIIREINNFYPNTIYINIIASHNTIVKRIIERSDGESRLDKESENQIRKIVNVQEENMRLVSSCIGDVRRIEVSSEELPEQAADRIVNRLCL